MWGATTIVRKGNIEVVVFQSAHPYVGCDFRALLPMPPPAHFNPRTPMWGATTMTM